MPKASTPPPRRTKQRAAILETLHAAHGPLNAQEILKAGAKKSAGLGLATVYRHVKALCESGDLTEVHVPGESPRYEPAGRAHHHHFLCTRCARLFEVEGCPGDLGHLTPPGFTLERHEITLIGLCDLCTAKITRQIRFFKTPSPHPPPLTPLPFTPLPSSLPPSAQCPVPSA